MNKEKVGFIGMGVMGRPMAGHISAAGYSVTVYDINRSNAEKLMAIHPDVVIVDSPRAVAEVSDVVITMLPSGKFVQEVTVGKDGLIDGFQAGSLLIDTTSAESWLTLETATQLAEIGVEMVDAPVSGAELGAKNAELVFMVGGDNDAVARATTFFNIMGKQIFHLGPLGSGHTMKCLNNMITAMTFLATAEGLAVGKHLGLDPNVMTDVLNVSTGKSWISETQFKQRITNRKFDDAFKLELMVKDIGIAMKMADREKLPVPLSAAGYNLWKAAATHAGKGASISEVVRWVEMTTKTEIRP